MSMFGVQIEALRTFAQRMDRESAELNELMRQLTREVEALDWRGPDRERFIREWHGQHVPNLGRLIRDVQEAARRAMQHALAQEQASR